MDPIDGEKDVMAGLVLLIVLTALGVGMYSLITGSNFAKPLIVLVLFEAGSFSMITSRHAPNIAPQSDENGVRGRVVNSPSPLARTADSATKGEVIAPSTAPRDEAASLAKEQKLEVAGILPNAPTIQAPKGRYEIDAKTQRRVQVAQASSNKSAGLVFDFPAPGCPDKLPTYESVDAICTPLYPETCNRNNLCHWEKESHVCNPKSGSYLPAPPIRRSPPTIGRSYPFDFEPTLPLPYMDEPTCVEFLVTMAGSPLAKGDDYARERKFQKAIKQYTKALEEEPNELGALLGRASAYERVGDKIRAVRDYCKILVITCKRERRDAAKARIAELTGPPATASPSPLELSPPARLSSDLRPTKSPPTSTLERTRRRNAIAPLAIEGETGTNYLIKLVRIDGRDSILIFVRGGETYSTKVPLGTYNIRAAAGSIWYGRKDFFGPSTRFFRLRTKDGKQVNFSFSRQGNMIHGMRFQLMKVVDGNTEEETISRDEF